FEGVEQTLDPLKLARFPLRTGQLMIAMLMVGITWIPGVATIVASVGTVIAWQRYPVSAAVAVLAGLVGAATSIAGSRLTTSVVTTLLRGRGSSRAGVTALVVLVVVAPLAASTLGGVGAGGSDLLAIFTGAVAVLGWTPFGAVWSVAGRLAMGDVAGAVGAGAIAIATLAAVLVLWRVTLGASLRVRGGGPSRTAVGGRLNALGWMPATPTGAVAARSLIYWFRDPRHARQLIIIPVLPALMLLWWWLIDLDGIAIATGPVVASLLPLSVFAGLSYDGTAFAAELAAGVRGVQDRLGRAVALLIIAVPAVLIVQVVVAIIIGRAGDLPALLGLSLGTLLVSVGVVSVSSARIVVPVARSGRNPFSAPAGAATTSIFASYAVMGATVVLAAPFGTLAIAAILTGAAGLGWAALAVGVLFGLAVAAGGVVLGGRVLDASGPAVLARLRLIRA
ncbi:MAG: type transport system permease protein, partial [Schumannella sp.]|nr:type transport system permease protein [Schumannella sp.]